MFKHQYQYRLIIIVLIIVGTILTNTAGFIFQTPWLMPILGAMIPYPFYFILVKNKQYRLKV